MSRRKAYNPIVDEWNDMRLKLFSQEEIAEIDIKVTLIGEMIKIRKAKGISQRRLEELSGVSQPVIARLESGVSDPQLSTVIKLLTTLGKTLQITDLKNS